MHMCMFSGKFLLVMLLSYFVKIIPEIHCERFNVYIFFCCLSMGRYT